MADEATQTDGGEDIVVEVDKDRSPWPRGLSEEEIAQKTTIPDDEVARYADEAKRRIQGLRIAFKEERAKAEQRGRDASTAANFAERVYRENQQLKENLSRAETALIDQATQRAENEFAQAQYKHKQAFVAQDPDLITTASADMARAAAEVDRLKILKPPPFLQEAPPAPQPQPPSPRVQAWVDANPWWKTNEEMRQHAWKTHSHLAIDGITEQSDPDTYFRLIDEEMRKKFPDKFSERPTEGRSRPVAVTGGQRSNGSTTLSPAGKRVVHLNESQVRLAARLGLTQAQYAEQWLREQEEQARGKAQ
jgi:hypothetical protein